MAIHNPDWIRLTLSRFELNPGIHPLKHLRAEVMIQRWAYSFIFWFIRASTTNLEGRNNFLTALEGANHSIVAASALLESFGPNWSCHNSENFSHPKLNSVLHFLVLRIKDIREVIKKNHIMKIFIITPFFVDSRMSSAPSFPNSTDYFESSDVHRGFFQILPLLGLFPDLFRHQSK